VVIRNLDILSAVVGPYKTDAILIVDADAVLTGSISVEFFRTVTRRSFKVTESFRRLQVLQLALCYAPEGVRASLSGRPCVVVVEHVLSPAIPEADYHLLPRGGIVSM